MTDQIPSQLHPMNDIAQPLDGAVQLQQKPTAQPSQIPPWVIGALVVVMLLVPLGLFLVTRGGESDKSGSGAGLPKAEPTRTTLGVPTQKPVATSTPYPSPTKVPTPSAGPSPTASISPTTSITPTSQATGTTSLGVSDVIIEDPQTGTKIESSLYAGQHVSLRAKLRNSGSSDAKNVLSYWKIQGNLVGRNDRGTIKANSDAVYDDVNSLVYSGVVLKEGQLTIAYFADPDNALHESNTADNSKSVTLTVLPTRSDLELSDIEFYSPTTGEKITMPLAGQTVLVKPVIKNLGQDKQVNYQLKWWVNDAEVKNIVSSTWIGAGESKVSSDSYQMTLPTGSTKLRLDVNTDNAIPETSTGNNSNTKTLSL